MFHVYDEIGSILFCVAFFWGGGGGNGVCFTSCFCISSDMF